MKAADEFTGMGENRFSEQWIPLEGFAVLESVAAAAAAVAAAATAPAGTLDISVDYFFNDIFQTSLHPPRPQLPAGGVGGIGWG